MTLRAAPTVVDDLPPSSKLVWLVLAEHSDGELTHQDLVEMTGLNRRTLSNALSRLESEGVVERSTDMSDTRHRRYCLRNPEKNRE
jgi:DNA-binding HxlR family transcriptional regulator